MFQTLLFIQLLLLYYTTQSDVKSDCSKNVSLTCPEVDFDKLNFLTVTWYKLENQKKIGIVRRGKRGTYPQYYNFTRVAMFGEKYSLFIPSVTPEDSGSYECAISANVGGKNLNLQVGLTVDVCVTPTEVTTVTPESITTCQNQTKDLPVLWAFTGYAAVGLTKIILCISSIWIIQIRSSRQQHTWRS